MRRIIPLAMLGFALLFVTETPLAQPAQRWVRTFGGKRYDAAHSAIQKRDGTFIVVGETSSGKRARRDEDPADMWILHLRPDGTLIDERTLGGRGHDVAYGVTLAPDGGYVVVGSTVGRGADFWVIKFSVDDQQQWERRIGGSGDDGYRDDYDAMSVIATDDGYVVAGNAFSNDGDFQGQHHGCAGTRDIVLVKLDLNGATQWTRALGGTNHEYVSQVVRSADGGLLVVGRTESYDGDVRHFMGEYDAWVVKLDAAGRMLWQRTLGGELWDWGSSIAATPDGGGVFAGYTYSWDGDAVGNHGDYDFLVMKLGADGHTEWRKIYGGLVDDFAHSIIALREGGFLVTGGTASHDGDVARNHGSFDIWALRIGAHGEPLGQASIGGSDYEINGLGASTLQCQDGSVLIVGTTKSSDGDIPMNHGDYDALVIHLPLHDLVPFEAKKAAPSALHRPGGTGKRAEASQGPRRPASSGAPSIAWQHTFGGSGTDRPLDSPQALVVKREGGYAFAATTSSKEIGGHGSSDVWVVSLDAQGKMLWQKTLGGSGKDVGAAIAQAKDGGFAVVATTDSHDGDVGPSHGMTDFWVVRLDARGRVLWKRVLGGSGPEIASSIAATSDGGFIVGGHSQSRDGDVKHPHCAWDWWVVKLGADGRVQWEKSYGGSSNDYLIQIVTTRDGGYAAIGRTESSDGQVSDNHGTYDYWVVKMDRKGAIEWEKTYGDWDWEWGNSIAQTRDGGFILGGYTYTFDDFSGDVSKNHGEFDYWVVKTDADGEIEWERSFGGANYELGYGIIQTRDGGYAMVGGSPSTDGQVTGNHGDWDVWVIALDARGRLRWEKSLGGSRYDAGYAIAEDHDGGLVILGETFSNDGDVTRNHGDDDVWLVKLRPEKIAVRR